MVLLSAQNLRKGKEGTFGCSEPLALCPQRSELPQFPSGIALGALLPVKHLHRQPQSQEQ
jgi:hypothetical protein